jgi:hypothetical protein
VPKVSRDSDNGLSKDAFHQLTKDESVGGTIAQNPAEVT